MRQFLAVCLLGLQSWVAAAAPVGPVPDLSMLAATAGDADPATVTSGGVDGQFGPFDYKAARRRGGPSGSSCAPPMAPPRMAPCRRSAWLRRRSRSASASASQELEVQGFGDAMRLTCSIGVATSDTLGVWGEHLVARADAAVYAAKNSGRNQVHVALPAAA